MSCFENHSTLTLSFAKNLTYLIDINDHGTVNAHKLTWIQRLCQLLNCLAQHEAFPADVQACIIVRRFDPFNLIDVDERIAHSVTDQNSSSPALQAG